MGESNFLINRLSFLEHQNDYVAFCEFHKVEPGYVQVPLGYPCHAIMLNNEIGRKDAWYLYPGDMLDIDNRCL